MRKILNISTFTLIAIIILNSCVEENSNPTISFTQPANNLIIEQDTILQIILNANDVDGIITKVELFIDGNMIREFNAQPYQYDWGNARLTNQGEHIIKAIAYDDSGATGKAEINVLIRDYREKYIGNFYFQSVSGHWSEADYTTHYDTTFYHGLIRYYEPIDSASDYDGEPTSDENPQEKITIEFKSNGQITSLLNKDGSLVTKSISYTFSQHGEFTGLDTISFNLSGGALGGGYEYDVLGVRE